MHILLIAQGKARRALHHIFVRHMFIAGVIFVMCAFSLFAQPNGQKQDRVALVIGNSVYQAVAKLNNPVNDAADIGKTLQSLGFDTEILTDADLETMEEGILRFRNKLSVSRESVGFFYYAGHGVQSGGENYLIPVDARLSAETLLRTRAVPLQFVMDSLTEANNKLNIMVLDACRDNPFSWARSSSRGLAVVGQLPPASIIVYSTGAGKVAQDGTGRNGAFTEELLKHLTTPGIDVTEVLRRTGQDVQAKTNGVQVPAIYSQFFGFLQLMPGEAPKNQFSSESPSNAAPVEEPDSELDYLPAFFDDASISAKVAIASSEKLAWEGKWLSAWNSLEKIDPNDGDPYVLAEKIRIVLGGYNSDDNYEGFMIADIPEDGDTEAARQAGTLQEDYIEFDPYSIVQRMEARGVEVPPVLASALGDFYYNAYYWCGDNYFLGQDAAMAEALRWYDIANENYILVDLKNIMQYGELLLDAGRGNDAVAILKEETEWEPDDTSLRLMLVNAYVQVGKHRNAYNELDTLIEKSASNDEAREYYRNALKIAFEQNDQIALNSYILELEKRIPNDWIAGAMRHKISARGGDYLSAQKIEDDLMVRFPLNLEVIESLLMDWLEIGASNYVALNAGYTFLNRWISWSASNPAALGVFYLYRSLYRYYSVEAQPQSDFKKASLQTALFDLDNAQRFLLLSPEADLNQLNDSIQYIREELQRALQ